MRQIDASENYGYNDSYLKTENIIEGFSEIGGGMESLLTP